MFFFGQLDVKTLTRPLAERAVIHSLMAVLKLCLGKGAVVAALLVELSPMTSQICGSNPAIAKILANHQSHRKQSKHYNKGESRSTVA